MNKNNTMNNSIPTLLILILITVNLSGCKIYQSIGSSFGYFVSKPSGPEFAKLEETYPDKAIAYIYRPFSEWSSYEIEAPSVYVNDERIFNIKGDSYTYLILTPGEYALTMRRPLGGFEGVRMGETEVNLTKILDFTFEAQAGEIYFLRYHELEAPKMDNSGYSLPEGDGPLQFVSESVAAYDINTTKLMSKHGIEQSPMPAATDVALSE